MTERMTASPIRPPNLSSRRAARVAPFLAMDVMSAAAAREARGESVVHMEVGQPSAPAPRAVIAAAQAALATGALPYTQALGLPALRERIARHYAETYGVTVSPGRVVVTTGSSAGFVLAFLALFDAGARIAVPQPGYPAYRSLLNALDLVPAPLTLRDVDRFAPTGDALRALHARDPLSGLLVMSPANPSGTVIAPARLADLCATARALGLRFISDEIYHGLAYGLPTDTALRHDDDAIVINSFSKTWCMTGWRIGWMVVPDWLARPVERLAQNLYISAPYLSQVAALAAFDAVEEVEAVRAGYAANRAGAPPRRLPEPRAGADAPGGRCLLPLHRRLQPHRRRQRLLPAHARRGGGRRNPGPRFRSRGRRPPRALLLRGIAGGLRRRGPPPQGLAALKRETGPAPRPTPLHFAWAVCAYSPVSAALVRDHQPARFGRSGSAGVSTTATGSAA